MERETYGQASTAACDPESWSFAPKYIRPDTLHAQVAEQDPHAPSGRIGAKNPGERGAVLGSDVGALHGVTEP